MYYIIRNRKNMCTLRRFANTDASAWRNIYIYTIVHIYLRFKEVNKNNWRIRKLKEIRKL